MADQTAGVLAGVAGASSVALGAFGAHALKEFLRQRNMLAIWETGVHYHMAHSLALLGVSVCAHARACACVYVNACECTHACMRM